MAGKGPQQQHQFGAAAEAPHAAPTGILPSPTNSCDHPPQAARVHTKEEGMTHGPAGLPRAQDHAGHGSDFLPGPEELKGWVPYPSEQDSPASITNNDNVGKPLSETSLHYRGVSLSLSSTKKSTSMIFPLLFLSGLCLTGKTRIKHLHACVCK